MELHKAFTSSGLPQTAYFFVAVAKKSLYVQKVRLATFSLGASNYARFCKSLMGTQFWNRTHFYKPRTTAAMSAGFTLIEVLVVMGILVTILGSSLFFDVSNYRGEAFRAERNNLVVALETARADALNNMHQSKHGVAINPGGYAGYVIFEGTSYAVSDPATRTLIPASYTVTLEPPSPSEVVFTQLSGDTGFSGDIVLRDSERNATTSIRINYEGKIGS
jgi:prepilin-type N-terminal cleavage/methylation domain-containing protein